jgi:hypothetical protein
MINMPAVILAAGLVLVSTNPLVPQGADDTAGYLCDTCDGSADDEIFCLGYIKGILNTFDAEVASQAHDPFFCIPNGTSLHDVKKVWENYCGTHDKERGARAASIVALGMHYAYPCSRPEGDQSGQ